MISKRDVVVAVSRTLALYYTLHFVSYFIYLVVFSLGSFSNVVRPTQTFYLTNTLFYISVAAGLWCLAEYIADAVKKLSDVQTTGVNAQGSRNNVYSFHAFVICLVLFVTFCYAFSRTITLILNLLWMSDRYRILESEFVADTAAWGGYGLCTAVLFIITPSVVSYLYPEKTCEGK